MIVFFTISLSRGLPNYSKYKQLYIQNKRATDKVALFIVFFISQSNHHDNRNYLSDSTIDRHNISMCHNILHDLLRH